MHSTTITAAFMAAVLVSASPVNRPRTELTSVLGSLGAVQDAVSSLGILKKSVKEGAEESAHSSRQLDGVDDVLDPLNQDPVVPEPVVPDLSNQTTIEFNTTIPNLLNDTTTLNTTITDPLTNTTIIFNSTIPNIVNQTTIDLNDTVLDTTIPDSNTVLPEAGLKSSAHAPRQDLAQMLNEMLAGKPQNVDDLNIPDLSNLTATLRGSAVKPRQFQSPGTLGPLGPGINATIPGATRFNATTGTLMKSSITSKRADGKAPTFIKPRQFQALNSVLAPLGLNVTDLGLIKKSTGDEAAT